MPERRRANDGSDRFTDGNECSGKTLQIKRLNRTRQCGNGGEEIVIVPNIFKEFIRRWAIVYRS